MIDFGALNRIGRDVRKGFEPKLDIKLRRREIHLLSMIEKHPNNPFVFYSERIGLERSSFSYLAETLELKGLILRRDSMLDKRKKVLDLTEKGTLLTTEIENQFQQYLKDMLSNLSDDEVNKLNEYVEGVKEIMGKIKF